jgi:hypothetical protein
VSAIQSGRRVVLVLQGGIGNQLFQLCAGETIRKKTGYEVFYDCDIGFRNDPSRRQFELAHVIPPQQRTSAVPGAGMWRSSLQERLCVTVERLMFRRGICSLPLPAALGMVRWWPASEVVCRSCFQLLDYVHPETVERIRGSMSIRPSGTSSEVAVHFRLARDRNRNGERMKEHAGTVLDMDYYRQALRKIRAEFGCACFRVFSDSGVIPENVFEPGDTVLLDRPLQDEAPSLTLSRMAHCGHFVIANSTFGWWAAYLCEAKEKRVYVPQDWRFNSKAPAQRGIFPTGWRRI